MTDKEKAMQDLLAHGKTFAQHLPSVGLKCGRRPMSKWENFRWRLAVLIMPQVMLLAIADALGVDVDAVLGEKAGD